MSQKYYVTTPIYYINDKPHIGSTYTTVAADVLARSHRLRGDKTFFLTGTDENSQKSMEAAEKSGKDINVYLEEMAIIWENTWKELGITFDDFIRTSEERHHKAVNRFWKAVEASGDIYKDTYERHYCVGCEDFKTDSELNEDDRCPLHPNKDLELVQEENYFFKASAYKDDILQLFHKQQDFVQPVKRLNEIRSYVKDGFADFSISREAKKVSCGIPVPGDDSQRIYVWFDALINYMSAVGYGTDDELFKKWWPANLHLVGKDIIKFHCALWPAMIMSAAKNDPLLQNEDGTPKLPEQIFAHGFFTIEGQKMSKSIGNVIDPLELAVEYPFDVIRYFFFREIGFGNDGDFNRARIAERYQSDLANTLGNLLNRAINMSRKYFDNRVPTCDTSVKTWDVGSLLSRKEGGRATWDVEMVDTLWQQVEEYYDSARIDLALEAIWNGENASLILANRLVEETQPFKLIKEDPEKTALVLYTLLEFLRNVAWMIEPVMPNISADIIKQLGQDPKSEISQNNFANLKKWGGLEPGSDLPEPKILFPRLGE
ncbi:MAG: methionine--tRNA ligase [Patescibacteria group bacterium]|nr:methionine--tRNA ligase [Patescibacteria group bacterium]